MYVCRYYVYKNTSTSFHGKLDRSNLGFCEVNNQNWPCFKKAWFWQPTELGTSGLRQRQASKDFKDEVRPETVTLLMGNVSNAGPEKGTV